MSDERVRYRFNVRRYSTNVLNVDGDEVRECGRGLRVGCSTSCNGVLLCMLCVLTKCTTSNSTSFKHCSVLQYGPLRCTTMTQHFQLA